MPIDFTMSVLIAAEFLLWSCVAFAFWKKELHRRFPAMGSYLALRCASMPCLLTLLYLQSLPTGHESTFFPMYFYSYWAVYVASAVLIYFVCLEIFRSALAPYAGLTHLGIVVFRWTTLVSLIVSLSTVTFTHRDVMLIPALALALMRSVSILQVLLLAFLCLCMNTLRLSLRELTFGLALGFGLMAANDFITSALWNPHLGLNAPLQYVNQTGVLCVLATWVVYSLLPEPIRKPVVLAPNSAIYRWNEIAAALGHGTKVAVPQPANSFFLSDVEKVVDKVLTRNLQGNETK